MAMIEDDAPMVTPETSWLFLPSHSHSPTTTTPNNPHDEVDHLVNHARTITELNPSLAAFLVEHELAYLRVLRRQVELVRSRSQAFEDAHITVFDKALLVLTQNGNDVGNPAAMEFYYREFLGCAGRDDTLQGNEDLRQSVQVVDLLDTDSATLEYASSPETKMDVDGDDGALDEDHKTQLTKMEPGLARLWSTYKKSQADFLTLVDSNDDRAITAAKFLRDTAENTLEYLKNRNEPVDMAMLYELRATFEMARAKAVSLTGGRNRKFDIALGKRMAGPLHAGVPNGPRATSRIVEQKSPRTDIHAARSQRRHDPHLARGDKWTNPTAVKARGHTRKGHSVQPGRGHSGIPYGYNRDVDQYRPSRH